MRVRSGLAFAVLLLVISVAWGSTAHAARTDRALARALEEGLEASHAQSVSAAVVFGDGRVWTGATGVADAPTIGRDATPSTPYAVASVTKTFVAAVAMQLVEDGALALDEPVSRWLPQLPDADRVTLRQLLSHTSGLTETPPNPDLAFRWTPDDVLGTALPPACAPGSCFRYSDNNYVAVGQVIANATGRPIAEVLRARILKPLALEHTWLQGFERPRAEVARTPLPSGGRLVDDPDGNVPSTEFATRVGAAGAVATTAHDLATFADALFRGRLVDESLLAAMTDFDVSAALECPDAERCGPGYGLGVAFEIVDGWRTHGHRGSTGSLVAFFPEQKATLAVLTSGDVDPYPAARAIAEAIPSIRQRVDLFTIRADGTGARRLPHRDGDRSSAAISPDGSKLAYARVSGPRRKLVVARPDGSRPRVVADDVEGAGGDMWSPDGGRLAFSAGQRDASRIFVVDADSSNRRPITRPAEWTGGASWSPDGTLIAYHVYEGPEMEIRVAQPDGTGTRPVLRMPIRGQYMGFPRWSPDGTKLVFTGADGGDTDIQVVALDGSNLVTLTPGHLPDADPAWGPDGRIVFSRLGDIFTVRPEVPSSLQQLTDTASEEYAFDWFPDASRIVYTGRL